LIGGKLSLPLPSNNYALLMAGLLAISSLVGQSENRDPYFTPTGAKSTSSMPRVIIRNMREDRAGNIWFATFGGPICYDGKAFTNFSATDPPR
jgi:ligand-binding sensor domain-containing protein